jgi:hypothetical protein
MVADQPHSHEKVQRSSVLIGGRMQFGIHTAFGVTGQAA